MAVLALTAWAVTALAGLYLLAIWLIEYDPDFQHAAATRLPVVVVCGHVLFAVAGLLSWVMYLITAQRIYSWTTVGALALIATLGLTMAWRWLGVYRARPRQAASAPAVLVPDAAGRDWPAGWATPQSGPADTPGHASGQPSLRELAVPPERYFPLSVVIAHGIFAVTTVLLVVLTVLGAGAS
jgi:hypothetical protein